MIFFIRASSFKNNIAWNTCFGYKPKFALIKSICFWLELDMNSLRQILLLFFVPWNWRDQESFWHLSKRQALAFKCTLH